MNLFNYQRRKSSVVNIGSTPMGGDNPIRVQSMTNTSTLDTEGSIEQSIRIIEAGGEYVRLTAQGVREAESLNPIRDGLRARGIQTPLVADIHFNPRAAEAAAAIVEKVRINPGNFSDPIKTFKTFEYTDEEYKQELEKIRERFIPFLNICKQHHTAIRIGVNHGSLSDRIMSRYGDTPQGMVESCMEFLRICVAEGFTDVVISIKASSTFVMVRTVRLLVHRMDQENMSFPLHLGVTEAGDGEDGRIKSAVGIGALLSEGIGDTIRVSLSEDPELEIPVAKELVDYIKEREGHEVIEGEVASSYNPFDPDKRNSRAVGKIGGGQVPVVIGSSAPGSWEFAPDYVSTEMNFLRVEYSDLNEKLLSRLKVDTNTVLVLVTKHANGCGEQKAAIHKLMNAGIQNPIVLHRSYNESRLESFQLKAAADCGSFFLDGLVDGIWLTDESGVLDSKSLEACSFGILQATGRRISKTEYISCPSCGRTLFDLQSIIKKVKEATSHQKGLKIGIMGCIVNGPGEMADADYGYVGAGMGKVSLYKGKECVMKNIPEDQAVEQLVALIKKHGDWKNR